ncbi:DNA repair protein [Pseudooceanicola sp.]|uniref:DNA repair protein n=1 Tax=Pseudooceanicola sp. TaxID=1914328 RepID=UPI00405A3214|tara:strand:+ start:10237 stop:11025 length:789 start_codon:yes stop_codon:yes gene_type:complete
MKPSTFNKTSLLVQSILQPIVMAALIIGTIGAVIATGLAFAGELPWPGIAVEYGETSVQIGMALQIGMTAFLMMLCVFLPTTWRVRRLENSHRRFELNMDDVTRAYAAAHAGDRAGVFQLKHEFDAVRERIQFLRNHPDLGEMEPGILEIAAQMSQVSSELARVYSDEKMSRARVFLDQRQQELATFEERIDQATGITRELVHWARQVELGEAVAQSRLDRLREEMSNVMPTLLPAAARPAQLPRRYVDLAKSEPANTTPAE